LKQKEATVKKLLGKYGPVNAIRGMEDPYHYRNKVISTFTPPAAVFGSQLAIHVSLSFYP